MMKNHLHPRRQIVNGYCICNSSKTYEVIEKIIYEYAKNLDWFTNLNKLNKSIIIQKKEQQ